jgi:hypothetical protein
LEILEAYGWAAQALELATGAEEVEVEGGVKVVEVEVWAAASVKPAARARVVSCMVDSRKTFAIGLERVYRIRMNSVHSEKRTLL